MMKLKDSIVARLILILYLVGATALFVICYWQMEVAKFNIVHNYEFGLFFGALRLNNWQAWEAFMFIQGFLWFSLVAIIVWKLLSELKRINDQLK